MNRLMLAIAGVLTLAAVYGFTLQDNDKAIKKVPTSHKVVALTFDDGPDPETTPGLLAVLREKRVRCTFFLLGSRAEHSPALAAAIAADGHEIASHSYTHRFLNTLKPEDFADQVQRAERALMAVAPRPTLIRPPGGGYNDKMVLALRERGYITVLWSIDPRDWIVRDVNAIATKVMAQIGPGDIVLLHEGVAAKQTAAAVGVIIDRLRERGYEIVTVSELLRYYEIRP